MQLSVLRQCDIDILFLSCNADLLRLAPTVWLHCALLVGRTMMENDLAVIAAV
jgi:hypothetical protein